MYPNRLNDNITKNLNKVKYWFLIPALLLLISFFCYFLIIGGNFTEQYVAVQKDLFFYLNQELAQLPNLQFNLTQLGDVIISFSLLSILIVYAPKFWRALISSAILSLIASRVLKAFFAMPRPYTILDSESFIVIGEAHTGYKSLPSGHSIATFLVITTLLFTFLPKKKINKILWGLFMISIGLIIAFSRVAVGAHYPFDVIIGSAIGYVVSILGIKINNKVSWLSWVGVKKYLPIFMILFTICGGVIIKKILDTNLIIFYISLIALSIGLFTIIKSYVQKN